MKSTDYINDDVFNASLMRCMADSESVLKPRPNELDPIREKIQFLDKMYQALEDKPSEAALVYQRANEKVSWERPQACLIGNELMVGRNPSSENCNNMLVMNDLRCMSRNHFRILRQNGFYILEDDWPDVVGMRRGSRNGTYVNSETCRQTRYALKEGDIIYAGGALFAFVAD
jgi:hypothetical protein